MTLFLDADTGCHHIPAVIQFTLCLRHSDGLVVNCGVFTLPLIATDVSGRIDRDCLPADSRPFIAGQENVLLRTLIDAASVEPPRYNPIVLHGSTGTGKTHLLHGLADRTTLLQPYRKVWVTSGADFARMYASAVELDSLAELRERAYATSLLVLDGLEQIATKVASQQELLHLVDECVERGCQLLCASRVSPAEWTWMLPGLRSRLESGLLIPLALPQRATRVEILRRLSTDYGVSISDTTIQELAATQPGRQGSLASFRQMRNAVLQLARPPEVTGTQSPSLADSRGLDQQTSAGKQESIRRIALLVARQFELKLTELLGSSRRKTVVQARGVAIYLARSLLAASFGQLGETFGNRDHTTILHAYRKLNNSLETDAALKQTVERLWLQLPSNTNSNS